MFVCFSDLLRFSGLILNKISYLCHTLAYLRRQEKFTCKRENEREKERNRERGGGRET